MGLDSSSYILCSSPSSWPSRLAPAGADTLPQEERSGLMGFSEDSSRMFCYGHSSMEWCTFKCHTLQFTVRVCDYTCALILPILCKV